MKFTKFNVIGSVVSLVFGGPIGLLVFIAGYIAFMIHVTWRGLLFIQSYLYLITLWNTQDMMKANGVANDLTPDGSSYFLDGALKFAQRHNGGRQLPVIAEAKRNGFRYKKPSSLELFKGAFMS